MADPIADLMHANLLEVFNQRDHTARRAAIARIYTPDILWADDDGVTRGRDALDSKAVELQAKLGDLQFVVAGPVYQTLDWAYLHFTRLSPAATSRSCPASMSRSYETASSPSSTPC